MVADFLAAVLAGKLCFANYPHEVAVIGVAKYLRQVSGRPELATVFAVALYPLELGSAMLHQLRLTCVTGVIADFISAISIACMTNVLHHYLTIFSFCRIAAASVTAC